MKRILVVDDDQDILFMLKSYLLIKGYNVKTSTTCDEGLTIFYQYKPDLVILDVNVGSADGRIMCSAIKAQSEYRHIPVILISANPEGLKSYQEHGADAAVEKPFNFPHLLSLIEAGS